MTRVAGLLFDLDRTLFDRDATVRALVSSSVRDPGMRERILARDDGGSRDGAELIAALAPELGWPDDGRQGTRFRALLVEHIAQSPPVQTLLSRLSGTYRMGITTNGSVANQSAKIDRLGIHEHFEAILISEAVGRRKPHPDMFTPFLRKWQLPAQEVWMIGDDPQRDVAGAQRVGMRTVWISHDQTWPRTLPAPDEVCRNVLELESILPSLAASRT